MKISKEELMHLARMSRLHLEEDEIAPLLAQIQDILTYAERVKEMVDKASVQDDQLRTKQINILREDISIPCHPMPLLEQAPERTEDFFVVPAIIESK